MEGISLESVTSWVKERIPDLEPPLSFSLIAGGHSNLTYKFVDQKNAAYVLRRPPLGHVLESAHDMGREFRIISALEESKVPVPICYGLCEDPDVNGVSFYIMNFVEGLVPHSAEPMEELTGDERQSFGHHVAQVLGDLHTTDVEAIGLGQLGRREGYLDRQLKRWEKQYVATQTHELPDMDESLRLLHAHKPEQIGFSIVHGDYRPGNMLIEDGKVAALLDWELCTLGDPLADVGYLMNNWAEEGDPVEVTAPTGIGGFPSRQEIMDSYQERTGRDLSKINYYRAFSHWRLAAISQGVYKRYLVGAMGEQEFDLERYKRSIESKARLACELLSS
ncbi:MAG: phosphotransferase family protein [Gammaproteobacteria bacterium]|nr:phosphotransferase family protein [Gammaproteobacteria bacterium]